MNNMDINNLLQMLSNMDKKELEEGMKKANQLLSSKSKEELLKDFQNKK